MVNCVKSLKIDQNALDLSPVELVKRKIKLYTNMGLMSLEEGLRKHVILTSFCT